MGGVCATCCGASGAFGSEAWGADGICDAAVKEDRARTAMESEAKARMVDPYFENDCRRNSMLFARISAMPPPAFFVRIHQSGETYGR